MNIEEFRTVKEGDRVKTQYNGIGTIVQKFECECKLKDYEQPNGLHHCSQFHMGELIKIVDYV